ncbi:MAG: nucleotidyltransferase domain-containing protein [Candidatus Helarchaeota archaeon]
MSDNYYHSKWKSIVNVMARSNLKISRIAQAGSRAKKTHRLDSDLDIIFSVSENPDRINFYPKLIEVLKNNFSHEKVYPGSNYNVVHLDFRNGGKFDIVLLSENEFDKEYKSILDYKRKNL